ncbi:MAG TPA: DUF1501 domain-containing protein [Polyangiaceae bacterium]|nr:DUF1501 domain-containing protein [Polyangiaceae bacterium]
MTSKHASRRQFTRWMFGSAGLAALATGLPAAFLRAPLAFAQGAPGSCTPGSARFLILCSSNAGDPVNANCPGTYEHAGIVHPPGAEFLVTPLQLGSTATRAAQLWTQLPQWALDRACFIHHATRTVVHPDMPKVLRLMGTTNDGEMLPSLLAAQLAPCLNTIQAKPVSVGKVALTASGAPLQTLRPTALKQLLVRNDSPLTNLRALRDRKLDEVHAVLKKDGTTEQRSYLDAAAKSRTDTRKLGDQATELFSMITSDSPDNQIVAAVGLIRLGVTPVVSVTLPFGSDNHTDEGLEAEVEEHPIGIGALVRLMSLLEQYGLQDRVTFAMLNVFGRTLARKGLSGRDHWPRHAVSLLIGAGIKPGVVGGLAPFEDDFGSVGIDSASGRALESGADIPYEETLSSVGKTIGAAVGVTRPVLDEAIEAGKVISASLVAP